MNKNYLKRSTIALAIGGIFSASVCAEVVPYKGKHDDGISNVPAVMPSAVLEVTDEPGKWFKDPTDGDSLVVVKPGETVLIMMTETNTTHTITSLLWQPGAKGFPIDQDQAASTSVAPTFDKPGLYVFTCRVHPYIFGAVVVDDPNTEGLDLGSEIQLVTGAKVPTTSDIAKKLLRTFFVSTTPSLWRDYAKPIWDLKLPAVPLNLGGTVISLDALNLSVPNQLSNPATPGVGEVWVNTQFETIKDKAKPGSATQVDAAQWTLKKKVKGTEINLNHPHNMWPNNTYRYIYQTEWFDQRLTVFDRESGKILNTQTVGQSPSHVISRPGDGRLYVAINAEDRIAKLSAGEAPIALDSTKVGDYSGPHGHHVTHDGKYALTPNALKSSVSIVELDSAKVTEIPTGGVIPIAIWSVPDSSRAYAANLLGTPPLLSTLTVIDLNDKKKLQDIDLAADYDPISGQTTGEAYGLLPIQTPVSPDGKYVVTANTLSATITVTDTATNKVVKSLPCEPGCHGVNFGMKKGGGYYAYVASKFANDLIVVDMDKLEVAGHILLADASDTDVLGNNGMGGQGVLPLPLAEHGHLQDTLKQSGKLQPEVEEWLNALTDEQKGSPVKAALSH